MYFISLPNQNQHFTLVVPRIRYQSPWKQEVQQIMTSVTLPTVLASCYFPSLSLSAARTVFVFANEGSDGITAGARLAEK